MSAVTEMMDKGGRISRVFAILVGIEHYRVRGGSTISPVQYACADVDAVAAALKKIYADVEMDIRLMKDGEATLVGLKEDISYTIRNLAETDLFIFYYAGHGFHGSGGNRLTAWDSNPLNIPDTTLLVQDHILQPLSRSQCKRGLLFIDACAQGFNTLGRAAISDLDRVEFEQFLDNGWYLAAYLACSPGEQSWSCSKLRHGIWTAFLLRALAGHAEDALVQGCLTDASLRDWLLREVSLYVMREVASSPRQTPQAIISASNSFRIRCSTRASSSRGAALNNIALENKVEYLNGTERRPISQLYGAGHKGTKARSSHTDALVKKLTASEVTQRMQDLYDRAKYVMRFSAREIELADGAGASYVDTPVFRYEIEAGQCPNDPAMYFVTGRLELRDGWSERREQIASVFSREFEQVVIEFEPSKLRYRDLVYALEDIARASGGQLRESVREQRVTYSTPDSAQFTFDVMKGRLEISTGLRGCLEIVDAARAGGLTMVGRPSAMLAMKSSGTSSV